MSVHFFGIRHHGPGSSKSLVKALQELKPDILLIEGPTEGQSVIDNIDSEDLIPPVAILIYDEKYPRHAVFYPFTNFSPEWQAIRYSLQRGIPARWIDLPWKNRFGDVKKEQSNLAEKTDENTSEKTAISEKSSANINTTEEKEEAQSYNDSSYEPLEVLAEIAGYSNAEEWWESLVERTHNQPQDIFQAVAEMMRALRKQTDPLAANNVYQNDSIETLKIPQNSLGSLSTEDDCREAYMRKEIRQAISDKKEKIAVICGAWHVPALEDYNKENQEQIDEKILALKPSQSSKLLATWVPWSNSRLSYRSGYGAGIYSPGWYQHLWEYEDKASVRWIVRAAQLLRGQDLDASSASVIEAVRLAEMLAIMREISGPGLKELTQAIQTVLCHGESTPLSLIRNRLEIGESIGKIPKNTPIIPLQKDLETWQTGKLLISEVEKTIELDLRQKLDLDRSLVLRRLDILGVPWGKLTKENQKGTAREFWKLKWDVAFVVMLIEQSIWGTTIEEAANNFMCYQAKSSDNLKILAENLTHCINAKLTKAADVLLDAIQQKSAIASEIVSLMECLPPLTELARYGDVRRSNQELILNLIQGMFERILIGLPNACMSLDDDAANGMLEFLGYVQNALNTLNQEQMNQSWQKLLYKLTNQEHIHALLRGWFTRILFEKKTINEIEFQTITRLALCPANPPEKSGAWIIGILKGTATWLIHQEGFWFSLNQWMVELNRETFVKILPLLRRAFSGFTFPERRLMAERIKNIGETKDNLQQDKLSDWESNIVLERARTTIPILSDLLLGRQQ